MAWLSKPVMDISKRPSKVNFYTILPSNSCPLIHPDNQASKFIIELQNPIYLDNDWEVALLDFTFVYNLFPIYSKSVIEYNKKVAVTEYISVLIDKDSYNLTSSSKSRKPIIYDDGQYL